MHRTGNAVLELTSKTGNKGWFLTSEATHFAFCDMKNRIAYIARSTELRQYASLHSNLPHITLNGCECIFISVNEPDMFHKITI